MSEPPTKKHKNGTADSKAASTASEAKNPVFLVFGRNGWIGGLLIDFLTKQGHTVHGAMSRMEDRTAVAEELDRLSPTHVLNAAGVTGRPNVDWCEDHKQETIRANVIGTLSLADQCAERGIHLTVYGTGCIYQYDKTHALGSGVGFTEDDPPNFTGSYYSLTKGYVQKMLDAYPNVLLLRVRMPISDDLSHRNFITKISKYERVVNIPNSMTVLHELLPVSVTMAKRGVKGTFNFTNPGVISHNQILDLYKQYIDPSFTYTNFTLEEQARILKADRSNNELDATRLQAAVPDIPIQHISEAIHGVFKRMKVNLKTGQPMRL